MKQYKYRICLAALTMAVLPLTACGDKNAAANEPNASAYDIVQAVTDDNLTDADKQRQYQLYLEQHLANDILKPLDDIEDASVTLHLNSDSDIIANAENASTEIYVSALLELPDGLTSCSASELAETIATAVGNPTTDNIMILDQDGTLLFPEETE